MQGSSGPSHVYVYIKDSYSFNDDSPPKSQYLGHWNKNGMVLSYIAAVNDFFKGSNLNVGNSTIEEWRYLPEGEEVNKPIILKFDTVCRTIPTAQ
ncbi:DUF6402 family protein [Burkholderia anthina]|uniref:DUF6402 family protein n=1 Tax=Burkholderia anthina TaxID=179879 RepID=UPI002445A2E0|nr:DUF6402 family protein [Burkholderia anthina]